MSRQWFVGLALLTWSTSSYSQNVAPVVPGERIRVTIAPDPIALEMAREALSASSPGVAVEGTVVEVVDAGVTAHWIGAPVEEPSTMPFRAVSRFEVQRSRSRGDGAGRGALWGAIAGATLFTVVWFSDNEGFLEGKDTLAILAAMGAGLGAGVGAGVGAAVPGKRWERVPLGRTNP